MRAASVLTIMLLAACGKSAPHRAWPPARPGYTNPIPAENAIPGDAQWASGPDAVGHQLEGYGDRMSARAGETIAFQVSSDAATTFTWTAYRLGWYGGAGARALRTGGPVAVSPQAACPMEAGTGLVRCTWTPNFTLDVTADFVSGMYALKLVRQDGKVRFIPFFVIDDRPADLLFQASVNTYEAYNPWGGESLYTDSSGSLPHGYAVEVSFDRPFTDGRGLGPMLLLEGPLARFLERYGYDVSYATNIDIATRGAGFLGPRGMLLSVGHDEYWAGEERVGIEQARDRGIPLAFFSSNTGYWKIRYADDRGAGNPRTIVCYKAGNDPLGPSSSGLFRGRAINQPENALLGVMYESWQYAPVPFVAGDSTSWLYEGTGLRAGDVITGIVGSEYDHRFSNGSEPAGLEVLAQSALIDVRGNATYSEAVSYSPPGNALVFASGTMFWARGLDESAVPDSRVARMTANVIGRALNLPIPPALAGPYSPPPTAVTMGPAPATVTTVALGLPAPGGLAFRTQTSGSRDLIVTLPRASRVISVDPVSGGVSSVAGSGDYSVSPQYDGIPGAQARFGFPVGVAIDANGRIYVADSAANVIRRIDSDSARTTSTLAGSLGVAGMIDAVGTAARFNRPNAIALDDAQTILYVADTFNHRIRAVNLQTQQVSTLAGSGVPGDRDGPALNARMMYPTGVVSTPDGRLFVASSSMREIKMLVPGSPAILTTVAGGLEGMADGHGALARLGPQVGLAWAGSFLAVCDTGNLRVRALVPSTATMDAEVFTLAFSGRAGDRDGVATDAEIRMPAGVAIGPDGAIYVADAAGGRIRRIEVAH